MRFGALQETRALRPPQMVLLKKMDLRRPLPQSLQAKICGPRSSDLDSWMDRLQRAPGTCIPSGTRFRERTPRRLARRRQARHSRAMRPRWLAWAAFILGFSCHGFSRTHADQKKSQDAEHRPVSLAGFKLLDYSLFIPHTSERRWWQTSSGQSNCGTEKNQFGLRFPKTSQSVHKSFAANIAVTLRS